MLYEEIRLFYAISRDGLLGVNIHAHQAKKSSRPQNKKYHF